MGTGFAICYEPFAYDQEGWNYSEAKLFFWNGCLRDHLCTVTSPFCNS
jgi:hypothetical protein